MGFGSSAAPRPRRDVTSSPAIALLASAGHPVPGVFPPPAVALAAVLGGLEFPRDHERLGAGRKHTFAFESAQRGRSLGLIEPFCVGTARHPSDLLSEGSRAGTRRPVVYRRLAGAVSSVRRHRAAAAGSRRT